MTKTKKIIVFTLLGFFLLFPSQALKAQAPQQIIEVEALGLVCDFCAAVLDKIFKETEKVEAVEVNLESKIVTLTLKEGESLSDAEIEQKFTYAGYDVASITREKKE